MNVNTVMYLNTELLFSVISHWMLLVAMVGSIGLVIALMIYKNQTPTNYILLGLFVSIMIIIDHHSQIVLSYAMWWSKKLKTLSYKVKLMF